MLGAIAEQFVLWFVERSRGRGRGNCEIASEGAGRGVLGDVGPEPTDGGLGAARAAHQLERHPPLARRWRRLLHHRHHVRQHRCLPLTLPTFKSAVLYYSLRYSFKVRSLVFVSR